MGFEAFDVIAYFDEKGVDYATEGKNIGPNWIGTNCFWCNDFGNHLGINLDGKGFSCFRCGERGNAVKLVMEIEQCSSSQAFKIIKKFEDLSIIQTQPIREVHANVVNLPIGVSKRFPEFHLNYLENRNFDPDLLIRKYDLYAGGVVGDFKYRIVAPVYLDKKLITLVGRDITDRSDKRYKALAISKSIATVKSSLYNIDSVKDSVIIVEGIFDCWRIGDGCVATFGTKFTHEQILMFRGLKRAFVLFDAEAAKEANHIATDIASVVPFVEVISLNEGDPAELNINDVRHLRRELRI